MKNIKLYNKNTTITDIYSKKTLGKSKIFKINVEQEIESAGVNVIIVKVIPCAGIYKYLHAANIPTCVKKFKGVAKKHPEDTNINTLGHDIAEHRAMVKAYNYVQNCFIKLQKYFEGCAEDMNNFAQWAYDKKMIQRNLEMWNVNGRK